MQHADPPVDLCQHDSQDHRLSSGPQLRSVCPGCLAPLWQALGLSTKRETKFSKGNPQNGKERKQD